MEKQEFCPKIRKHCSLKKPLEQTLKNLPEGRYKLTIAHRTGYVNSATSSLTIMAGAEAMTESFVQGSNGFFASAPWETSEVDFTVAATGNVKISAKVPAEASRE